jgi:asparagine synthase (glutamine-hydrolysing)
VEESAWQERVVRHLGLSDWHKIEASDELDLVGPIAAQVLRRHGVLYPPTAFFFAPLLKQASGGSLLTGAGGDELFGAGRWKRAMAVLAGRARPESRDVLRLTHLAAPTPIRRAIARHRGYGPLPWLRAEAQQMIDDAWAGEASEPARWHKRVRWLACRRYMVATRWSLSLLANDTTTLLVHPFLEGRFIAALGQVGGRTGLGDRTTGMRALFTGLLPDEVLARPDKTSFELVFWGPHTRSFTGSWSGGGVDSKLVDEAALREVWAGPAPVYKSALLVQATWLVTNGRAL